MTKKNDELRIDLAGNPGVAAYFSDKKPGDKCEFTVSATVKEIDPANDAVLSINKITHEDDSGEKTEITADADEPMKMEVTKSPAAEADVAETLGEALKGAY